MDLTAATLSEPIGPRGISAKMTARRPSLASTKLSKESLKNLQGQALNRMVTRMLDADPAYTPEGMTESELKIFIRRTRYLAFGVLRNNEHQLRNQKTSTDEQRVRQDVLQNASRYARSVKVAALTAMRDARDKHIDVPHIEGQDFDHDFPEGPMGAKNTVERHIDEVNDLVNHELQFDATEDGEWDVDPDDRAARHDASVKIFLEILLHNHLNEINPWVQSNDSDRQCNLCIEDNSTTDDAKNKVWPSAPHLKRHMESSYHAPFQR